jgi:hypothetical protein
VRKQQIHYGFEIFEERFKVTRKSSEKMSICPKNCLGRDSDAMRK